MAIRYDKRLNREIYQTVYAYNKKVKSLNASDPNVKIPNLITTKDLKTKDTTNPLYSYNRTELKRKLKQMKRFLEPGQEMVMVTPAKQVFSKWEYHNLQMQRGMAIRRIKQQMKQLEETRVTYAGRKSAYSYAQMGNQQYLNLQQKLEYLETHKLGELKGDVLVYYKRFLATNTKARRDKEWKQNFIDIVLNIGYEYRYDVEGLRQKLEKLSVPEFIKLFNEERLLKDLAYYYKLLKEPSFDKDFVEDDVGQLLNALKDKWPEIMKSLKG